MITVKETRPLSTGWIWTEKETDRNGGSEGRLHKEGIQGKKCREGLRTFWLAPQLETWKTLSVDGRCLWKLHIKSVELFYLKWRVLKGFWTGVWPDIMYPTDTYFLDGGGPHLIIPNYLRKKRPCVHDFIIIHTMGNVFFLKTFHFKLLKACLSSWNWKNNCIHGILPVGRFHSHSFSNIWCQ